MSKIAVFDSGLGGISVLSGLRQRFPEEDFIYYGDSLNAPYGDKSDDEILRLSTDICETVLGVSDVKCFVVACNTTTTRVLGRLEKRFPDQVFLGIEPAVGTAARKEPGKNILVLATTATIGSEFLKCLADIYADDAVFTLLAAPGIVPFVESREKDEIRFEAYLKDLLKDYKAGTDAVVLGCTHFPFVMEMLRNCFDKPVRFYDGSGALGDKLGKFLKETGTLNAPGHKGNIIFLNSDPGKVLMEEMLLKGITGSEDNEIQI